MKFWTSSLRQLWYVDSMLKFLGKVANLSHTAARRRHLLKLVNPFYRPIHQYGHYNR